MTTNYILVRTSGDPSRVDIAKAIEEIDGVDAAALVYRGSRHAENFEYTGEFYSTPQANARVLIPTKLSVAP